MNDVKTDIVKATESAAIKVTPETVRRYINPLATDQEIALFLNQCAMFGLNPFKREIYLIKYSAKDPATFVTGYEVYLKRAERTGKWAGMESGTVDGPDGMPIKAWAKIHRKDWQQPLSHEVVFSEYAQYRDEWANGQKTGKRMLTRFWADKPRTMLKKVAIAQAMRMAFPDEFGGMPYVSEEMPIDHTKLPTAAVETETPKVPSAEPHKLKNVPDEFTFGKALPADTEPEAAEDLDKPCVESDPLAEAHHDDVLKVAQKVGETLGLDIKVSPLCSQDQVREIMDGVAALDSVGFSASLAWRILDQHAQKVFGHGFNEPSELTADEATRIIEYLKNKLYSEKTRKDGKK